MGESVVEALQLALDNWLMAMKLLGVLSAVVACVWGHGYMKDPAARNCMWRFGFKNPKNWDDTGLYCGSFGTQWDKNHGACGVCGALYSSYLNAAIERMHSANKYSKMVLYIEACFSGSMFLNRLRTDRNVYAMTAANERESSYSCYYDRRRRTYLGDEFSVKWMQDSEASSFNSHTLWQQYMNVKGRVRMSHVSVFGDTRGMGNMAIGKFQGSGYYDYQGAPAPAPITDAVPTWDVPYMSLMHQLQDANTTEERMELLHEMQLEQTAQLKIRGTMESIAKQLSPSPALMMHVHETKTSEEQDHCYEQSVVKYLETCTAFSGYDYAMKDLHVFANLCNRGTSFESISQTIEKVCA